jgi:GLPGLI family protein
MNMNRLIYIIGLLALSTIETYAAVPDTAFLKAQYEQWSILGKGTEKSSQKIDKFILQVGDGKSYFYDPQTYYVDSIENDPVGRGIYDDTITKILRESVENNTGNAFEKMEKLGLLGASRYRSIKNFSDSTITVYDWISPDFYEYNVDMADLKWELQDSMANVLGYDCQLASADYHGRHWMAWFAPDIPVQDGPWQLCGLPGLILKAETVDGIYGFIATGLQQCNEAFKPTYINQDKLFKSKRKSYLKQKDYGRRNRGAMISAMTNGKVNPSNVDYKGTDDFLETDYHE